MGTSEKIREAARTLEIAADCLDEKKTEDAIMAIEEAVEEIEKIITELDPP